MANVAPQLERLLDAPALALLRAAGELAAGPYSHARELYLVGGPVRDMFLGIRPEDTDLSVVGDGEAFARLLADRLGGRLAARSEFGTARVELASGPVDIATARHETYAHPGALPLVTPAGIREDLLRRDFTVNAMAVAVTPDHWGALSDPAGGQADILRQKLRVLHASSFQDDPTRMFRGVRYAARLGFTFEQATLDHLLRDVSNIRLLSPARVKAELQKVFAEPARATALRIADDLGLLAVVHPALRLTGHAAAAMEKNQPDSDRLLYDLALLTSSLAEADAAAVVTRLGPPVEWREVILAGPRCKAIAGLLEQKDLAPSEAVSLLETFPLPVLEAQRDIAPLTRQRERLDNYIRTWRHVRPECDGNTLIAAGVPEGPLVGELLAELHRARLDGKVSSREDEIAHVRRRLPVLTGLRDRSAN
jgi:tRNA nucleotidyltransferase (CCA-adding enzyme)